jgi:hypothetical protein
MSGRERWCALRKEGGGIALAWQLSPGDNYRQIVRDIVEPD